MALACNLSSPELRKRRETVIADLSTHIRSVQETADSYTYTLPITPQILVQVASFIETERQCCEFFSFRLLVPSGSENLFLEISGPPGTKEFLKSELGL
jgi:hypothetical protein